MDSAVELNRDSRMRVYAASGLPNTTCSRMPVPDRRPCIRWDARVRSTTVGEAGFEWPVWTILEPMIIQQRLLDTFLAMCRINSPARQEREVIAWTRAQLKGIGIAVEEDGAGSAVGGNANNLICTLPASVEGAPKLLLSAHFDTVEPNPDVKIIQENGLIRSDGSTILGADDKAGMAPILEAMRVIKESALPHGQIQLALTICEEVGLLGAKHLDYSKIDADMGFVLDSGPPVGSFIVHAPGLTMLNVRIEGRAAHAGVCPEEGINAIAVAAEAIAGMKLGRLDEETTANIGKIAGGEAMNIVAPSVDIVAEARSRDQAKLEAQVAHMTERFQGAAQRSGAKASVEARDSFRSYHRRPEEEVVRIGVQAARNLGLSGGFKPAGGGSDGNVFNERGIPSVVVCTGMQKIHTHEEFCTVEDLVKTTELTLEIIRVAAGPRS